MTGASHSSRGLSPEYVLLGFLLTEPMHGYELHQRLKIDLGEIWYISQSQAYNILKRLEGKGLVTSVREDQEKLPDRVIFHITEGGQQHFEDWLNLPTRSNVKAIRVEFLTKLFFSQQRKDNLCSQLIEAQREHTEEELKQLKARFAGIPESQVFNKLGLSLRLRQIESTLTWLDEIQGQIEDESHAN